MRESWTGFRKRGGPRQEPVCGRKFCPHCGRWRHLCDFKPRYDVDRLQSFCDGCRRRCRKKPTAEQRELRREYERFYLERRRRLRGSKPRVYRSPPKTVADRVERIMLDRAPLMAEVRRYAGEYGDLARRAGIPQRTITRLLSGNGRYVRLDTADKLAVAMGIPLACIYPRG